MQSLPYVYIQSEPRLYTVGHYSPAGWLPESDHPSADSAPARVHYLNGGPAPKPERPTGPTPAYVRELEAAVSEAVDILSGLLVQDDTGLVFVSSADGKVIDRAVVFLAAAKEATP